MNAVSRSGWRSQRIALILVCCAVLILFTASARAQNSFSFPSANCPNVSCITLNGSATYQPNSDSASFFELTPSSGNQVGSAWYNNPGNNLATLPLAQGFTSTFTFRLYNQGGIADPFDPFQRVGADGIAFIVQNGTINGTSGINTLGPNTGAGGELGYTGLTNSVAVQFDSWCNQEYADTCAAQGAPTSADAVSIQSCGTSANTVAFGTCTYGRVDLSGLAHPIYISDGQPHTAQVAYAPAVNPGADCGPGSALGAACGTLTVIVDGQAVLTVPFSLSHLGLDNAGDAYVGFTSATGGSYENQDVTAWTFNWNSVSVVAQPINTQTPPDLPANFNTNTNNVVSTDTDYSTSNGITNPLQNPVFLSINNALSQSNTWPQYVVGTPWATSLCTIKPGNGGADLCSLYINACFDAAAGPSTADDFKCPQVADTSTPDNFITLKDTFDWPQGGKQAVAPGTTIALIKFSPSVAGEKWNPSTTTSNPVCTQVAPISGGANAQCDLTDTAVDVYGDQTTTRGTSPKTKGWLISAYGVPMPLSHVNLSAPTGSGLNCASTLNNPPSNDSGFAASIWNNGACLVDFVVDPASLPANLKVLCAPGTTADPCNNYQAAPIATFLYGKDSPAVQPGPIPSGDTLLTNQSAFCSGSPCAPAKWDVGLQQVSLSSLFGATDGHFVIHWSAKDTAGIAEKNVQRVESSTLQPQGSCPIPGGFEAGPQCYLTNYFTTMVNLDSTNPTVSSFAFSPAGGSYTVGQNVTANFTCADPLANNVASGIASCTAVTDTNSTPFNTGGSVSTATPGAHTVTVTAVDHAGNKYSQVYNYTVTANSADLAIFEQETTDYVKHGTNLTYINWALDLSKLSAQGVTITVQMPSNILGGVITAKMAIVSCSLLGCSGMPTSGGNTCGVSGATVTCNVGTLPSVLNLKGAVVKLTIPVASAVPAGTTFKINSTVTSFNDPNPKNNAISDTITVTN